MRAIRDRLREMYGQPVNEPHGHPIAELIKTVLSQHTNDRNRDRAFAALRERFPTWEEVRDAPVAEVEEAIRPGGLAKQKAPRIQAILEQLGEEPDLDWTETAPREESLEFLLALPGVGRKTAACVLIFTWGIPEIPVDVHVHRVGGRLGLFPREGLVRARPRRDAGGRRPRGRLRAAHEPDPPRARALPPETALRGVRAAADVPLVPRRARAPVVCAPRNEQAHLHRLRPAGRRPRGRIPWLAFRSKGDAATGDQEVAADLKSGQSPLPDQLRHLPHALRGRAPTATTAPNLDELLAPSGPPERPNAADTIKATEGRVLNAVENGVDSSTTPGRMPGGILNEQQAKKSPNSSPPPPAKAEPRPPDGPKRRVPDDPRPSTADRAVSRAKRRALKSPAWSESQKPLTGSRPVTVGALAGVMSVGSLVITWSTWWSKSATLPPAPSRQQARFEAAAERVVGAALDAARFEQGR